MLNIDVAYQYILKYVKICYICFRFLGVPRVWEKMYEKILAVGASSGGLKKTIATWANSKALEYHLGRIQGSAQIFIFYILQRS